MLNVIYEENETEIKKIDLAIKENVLLMEPRPMLDQSESTCTERNEIIKDDDLIGEKFDYLDRYVLLKLIKKNEEVKEKSFNMLSCTVSDTLIELSSSMPIRGLRVEPQVLKRMSGKSPKDLQNDQSDETEQKNCNCLLL